MGGDGGVSFTAAAAAGSAAVVDAGVNAAADAANRITASSTEILSSTEIVSIFTSARAYTLLLLAQ